MIGGCKSPSPCPLPGGERGIWITDIDESVPSPRRGEGQGEGGRASGTCATGGSPC
jgi:hypothetical protein